MICNNCNASVQETAGIRVVKVYVREYYEIDKFKKASDAIYREAENLLIFNSPTMQLSMYGCIHWSEDDCRRYANAL